MARKYVDGNPVGFDANCVIATFSEPCPGCGGKLDLMRGTFNWKQRAHIEVECPNCNGAWVWTASPTEPLRLAETVREPVIQMNLFAGMEK